jgi:hypothetical protein
MKDRIAPTIFALIIVIGLAMALGVLIQHYVLCPLR